MEAAGFGFSELLSQLSVSASYTEHDERFPLDLGANVPRYTCMHHASLRTARDDG